MREKLSEVLFRYSFSVKRLLIVGYSNILSNVDYLHICDLARVFKGNASNAVSLTSGDYGLFVGAH